MKRSLLAALALATTAAAAWAAVPEAHEVQWRDGDLVFRLSESNQATAIALASRSIYTHVGVVAVNESTGAVTVIEAVQPVREVPLAKFLGRARVWSAARLPEAETANWGERVVQESRRWIGTRYDLQFAWSDDRMYCSELVWKAFERGAKVRLTEPERLGDLHLDAPPVRRLIRERLRGVEPDEDSLIVTPAALARSADLEWLAGAPLF